jgi:hypothetical protein
MEMTRTLAKQLEGKAADGPDPFCRASETTAFRASRGVLRAALVQRIGRRFTSIKPAIVLPRYWKAVSFRR